MNAITPTAPAIAITKSKEKVVVVENLNKRFGDQQVLQNLSLHVFKEENLVVLGKSGSGKSVLIKCLVQLLEADTGNIQILNQETKNLNKLELGKMREKVGFLFQSGAIYDSMTVKENLLFPLKRIKKQLTNAQLLEKVKETLENVGLADTIDKMPSELSGGMRKRVSLARTIIVEPEIMLYDEPTTGLDPVTSYEISMLILKIQKIYKTSSIIITHDLECARITANRVIMLHHGSVYLEGNIAQFEASTDPLIASFFNHRVIE